MTALAAKPGLTAGGVRAAIAAAAEGFVEADRDLVSTDPLRWPGLRRPARAGPGALRRARVGHMRAGDDRRSRGRADRLRLPVHATACAATTSRATPGRSPPRASSPPAGSTRCSTRPRCRASSRSPSSCCRRATRPRERRVPPRCPRRSGAPAIPRPAGPPSRRRAIRPGRALAYAAQTGTANTPAGYRTATRLIRLADGLGHPVLTLVDTPGAANDAAGAVGIAISDTLGAIAAARVPVTTLVIGEGGSGGALALASPDELWIAPDAYFAVIAPEAAAAILKRDEDDVPQTADDLRLGPRELIEVGIARGIAAPPGPPAPS